MLCSVFAMAFDSCLIKELLTYLLTLNAPEERKNVRTVKTEKR